LGPKRALALGRAGVVLLLGLGFSRLVIGFGGIGFCCLTCFRKNQKHGFHGRVLLFVPVSSINSLDESAESCEGVQLVVVDHVIFDMFGQSIVSLSVECWFSPPDTMKLVAEI